MTLQIIHTSGKNTELEVNKDVFGAKPNERLLTQAVYVYQSNQRQGTSKVKTRSDINRTKKKWYKQKGTGNARHGARTPNIFVGGGVSHGPTGTRDWSRELAKSQKKKALIYALSLKARDKALMVSDEIEKLSAKTKDSAAFFNSIVGDEKRVLVVLHQPIENVLRSTQNIENVLVTQVDRLNVYETLLADTVLLTKDAVKKLEIRLTKVGSPAEKTEKTSTKDVEVPTVEKPAKAPKAPEAKKTVKKAAKVSVKAKAETKATKVKKVAPVKAKTVKAKKGK